MTIMLNAKRREDACASILRMITVGLGYGYNSPITVALLPGDGEDTWELQMSFGNHKIEWSIVEENTLAKLNTIAGKREVRNLVYMVYAETTVPSFNRMEPDYTDAFIVGSAVTPERAVVDALLAYFREEMYHCLPLFESPIEEEV